MDESEKKKLLTRSGVKGNVRYITITDNIPEHWDSLISIAKTHYQWWAYIYHDKDNTDKHIHLLCYDKGGTSLKSHCDRFSSVVPSHFVEKVWNGRAMARYLIHKDDPQKHQYQVSEVFTSSKDKFASFLLDENKDVIAEYKDFISVLDGSMSVTDFLDKYRGEFSSMPFHHKLNTFYKIYRGAFEFYLPPKAK